MDWGQGSFLLMLLMLLPVCSSVLTLSTVVLSLWLLGDLI